MQSVASIFCHISDKSTEPDTRQELQRQYDLLIQYAMQSGYEIEHSYFHKGDFDAVAPDSVFRSFLQDAQKNELGLILVESKAGFPLPQQGSLPHMELYFVQEARYEIIDSKNVRTAEGDEVPQNICFYPGF